LFNKVLFKEIRRLLVSTIFSPLQLASSENSAQESNKHGLLTAQMFYSYMDALDPIQSLDKASSRKEGGDMGITVA